MSTLTGPPLSTKSQESVAMESTAPSSHGDPDPEVAQQKAPQHPKLIMLALCTTMFLVSLNTFIMTTALPTIAVEFATSDAGYAWIASAYMLAFGVVVPVWANISNVFGRRIILIITNICFLAGTLIGALSVSAAVLTAGRVIQGIGGGGLTVLVNLCVGDLFTIRLQTVKVPLLQGLKSIDWLGNLTIIGATLMLLLGLQLGGTVYPWDSSRIICLLAFGAATFGLFAIVEWKVKAPLLPLRFFSLRSRLAILGINASQSFITTGCTYFLPLYFQLGLGLSSLTSGIYFLPTTLTLAVFFLCVGHIVKRTGEYRLLIRCGACALVLGTGIFIDLQPYISWPRLISSQIIVAIGLGLTYQAPLIAFHAQIEEKDVPMGTSTFQFIKTFCQTVSVVIGQVILGNGIAHRVNILQRAGLSTALIATLSGGNAISSASAIESLAESQRTAVRGVIVAALRELWIFYTAIASFGLLASIGIAKTKLS
ncbi:MAG: hypothetical protein Q9163_002306 [Psora crenata]